jgi:flavin reductase (DIM6/NTAB) family NADH-FMN oxidoreductase RutF
VFTCIAEILQSAGDRTVVIGEIIGIDHDPTRRPVVYHRRTLLPTQPCEVVSADERHSRGRGRH